MSIFNITYNNLKNNIKIYTMFFISMIFSVVILTNFSILLKGEALKYLGSLNEAYIRNTLNMLIIILLIFMIFLIWYSTNVFLKSRKREIGIYTFMGVDNITIGKMYFFEMMLIGIISCSLGIGIGALLSKFFQMIVFKVAEFNIDVKFNITLNSIIFSAVNFLVIFLFMSIKGFINIARSNVIDLLNDSKKAERMPKISFITYIVALMSIGLIIYGYYLVVHDKSKAVKTLILVCIGTYGFFAAIIPAIFNFLLKKKSLSYKGENIITFNNLAYRLKKNYTTYGTIAILTACTITVLATAFSMKTIYTTLKENNELYSISLASTENNINEEKVSQIIETYGKQKYKFSTEVLYVECADEQSNFINEYMVLTYDQLVDILKFNNDKVGLSKINKEMIKGNNAIYIKRYETLASLANKTDIKIDNINLKITDDNLRIKTLGGVMSYPVLVVNDINYAKLKTIGKSLYFYGVKIDNDKQFLKEEVLNDLFEGLNNYINTDTTRVYIGVVKTEDSNWLKVVYAVGIFLFLVFMLSVASIIYTKIYSDANEDKEKYSILLKIGATKNQLRKSVVKEVVLFYAIPVVLGLVHSYFAIMVLAKLISNDLTLVYLASIIISIIIFGISAIVSIKSFEKIVQI